MLATDSAVALFSSQLCLSKNDWFCLDFIGLPSIFAPKKCTFNKLKNRKMNGKKLMIEGSEHCCVWMFGVFGQCTNLECLCVSESASQKNAGRRHWRISRTFSNAQHFWRRAANHEHSIFVVIRSHLFTNIGAVLFNIRWHFVRLSICPAIHSPFDGDAPIFESLFLSRRISVRFFPLLCPFEIMQMSKLVHKYPCSFYCAAWNGRLITVHEWNFSTPLCCKWNNAMG